MAYTFEELSKKTVFQLREIAKDIEHESLQGYSTMHKEQLLPLLCKVLGVEVHPHHVAAGVRSGIKAKLRKLQAERDKALQEHNHRRLAEVRRAIHHLKRELRKLSA